MSAVTAANRAIVALALVAGGLVGLWLLLDAQERCERGDLAVQWLDESIDLRRGRAADLDAYAQDVGAVRKDLAMLEQQLPAQFPDEEIAAGLRVLAGRHGLNLVPLLQGRDQPGEFYARRAYTFSLQGSLPALQAFLRDYADIVPLQRLRHVHVVAADGAYAAEIETEYFRYVEEDPPHPAP
ncbi:type 4a pilus biogenesis protein PilO [Tahibacter sp. UC22_41]|uniref:type 4a pilus biogenesis protein PilO n=1 Tax=Tahibacter sp. UC22_41 TaxID=3350178 RepID=UPI0036D7FB9E